jgi:lipopolysaccharide export system ATP-binding protein
MAKASESASKSATIDEKRLVISSHGVRVARGETTILRGVSVEAHAGEVVGVLGPSGAGKSTLFRSLVGELAVEDGRIVLDGEDVTRVPLWARARRGLAYVPQTPSVLWDLSVRENLRVYRRIVHGTGWLRRASPDEDASIDRLARRVDLDGHMDVRAGELSGGERRRLEIARALTRPPKVLVCDEPFAGVDPRAASRIGDMLRDLAHSGVAVLLADHHVAEALRICSRALLLLDGQVAVDADPETFQEDPLVVGRYLGSWARSLPPPSR